MYGGGDGDEKITQLRGQRVVFLSIGRTGKIGKMFKLNNRTTITTTTTTAPARTRRTVVVPVGARLPPLQSQNSGKP